jgi:hypothetical protein
MIIDPQVDFHEGGKLAVPGALRNAEKIVQWVEKNLGSIDEIYVTLDTHEVRASHTALQ